MIQGRASCFTFRSVSACALFLSTSFHTHTLSHHLTPSGDQLQPALPALIAIISAGLRDAERVRMMALKAVEPLMMLVNSEADITQFHGLVVNMIQVGGAVYFFLCVSLTVVLRCFSYVLCLLLRLNDSKQTELVGCQQKENIRLFCASHKRSAHEKPWWLAQRMLQCTCASC